ncbi:hypothetical protein PR048_032901 [Dryococelus australis]|uniref:DDE-1 domain-containing protein n=1 Tax=Dryococelus australis TaxID=614101 RepID=A0ABQ9G3J6_9NEOP|nr:hypothetical protein PR048_032901 [Dryococelus australis]
MQETFSPEQLAQLKEYVVNINKRVFGLTKDYNEKKAAGLNFVCRFIAQCNKTLRKPDATSTTWLSAFNKVRVATVKNISRLPKYIMWTSRDFPQYSRKHQKADNETVIWGKRAKCDGCLLYECSWTFCTSTIYFPSSENASFFLGWITYWIKHFAKHANPSSTNRLLLLMDNHYSHVTQEAINFCRDHHVVVVGFPAHSTHNMQPQDVTFLDPSKQLIPRHTNILWFPDLQQL